MKQTEELLANGKVTSNGGRGKAYASGTAYAHVVGAHGVGGGFGKVKGANQKQQEEIKELRAEKLTVNNAASSGSSGSGGGMDKVGGESVNDSSSSSSSSSSAKDDFEETFDWIEVAISRIERAIDNLDQKANNIYKSWSDRNSALTQEIGKVREEIKLQEDAAQEYLREANQVGLSADYVRKIQDGSLSIQDFKGEGDEKLVEKIKEYQELYEKYLNCTDAAEELREQESKLYAQRFENIQTQYDGILQGYEHTEAMLNEYISQAEEQGYIVSKKYYQALINNEKSNIDELRREQADLIAERDNAVAEGKIVKGSEAWYEQCAAIDEVTQSIEEGSTALLEYARAMEEIDWSIFDLIQERISDVVDEADFLIELMSNADLYDDKGKLTEQGAATLGNHALKHNAYMYSADDYGSKIDEIDSKIASGEYDPYDQNVIDKRREYIELQRECILNAEQEKEAIANLVSEGIDKELDALSELIDKKNESLEAEKDLYEYNKQVQEQTENIASIRKEMAAYENDTSEEARAKIQELKVSLEDAEADLKETEWDKYISDTEQILTSLYDEYELVLNQRLDDTNYLLSQVVDGVNATTLALGEEGTITNALGNEGAIAQSIVSAVSEQGGIHKILNKEVTAVGTSLSNAMNSIWNAEGKGTNSILTTYGAGFQQQQTSTNLTLDNIKADVDSMAKKLGAKAEAKVQENKTQPSSVADPTKGNKGNNGNNGNNNGNKQPSKSAVTDDQLMGIAASIWVYGNGSGWGNDPIRSGKVTEKFDAATAKKVQELINKHGSNGDLYNFWIKRGKNLDKYKYNAFKLGAKDIDETQLAWTQEGRKQEFIVRPSDGAILTPVAKGDSVLTSAASNNIWDMANSPAEFIKDNLGIGSASVPSAQNVNNNITQHFENITFSMPNVHGYNDLLTEMQRDPKFEKLVLSMTIDRIAGRSSLAKGKSIR